MSTTEAQLGRIDTTSSPEAMDHGATIRELLTLDDETVASLRPQLWDMAEQTASLLFNPQQIHAMELYAGALDWLMFGQPNSQLPEGILLTESDDAGVPVLVDSRIPYLSNQLFAVYKELEKQGLAQLVGEVREKHEAKAPGVQQELEGIIKDSAEYKLLKSFDDTQQRHKEEPLDRFWRQIKERQAEDQVKRRFGMSAADPIVKGTVVEHDLRRRLYALDDETLPKPQRLESKDDALNRARTYLEPFVKESFETRFPGLKFQTMEYSETFHQPVIHTGEDVYELADFIDNVVTLIQSKVHDGPTDQRFISGRFLERAIFRIMDPRPGNDLGSILNETMEASTVSLCNNIYNTFSPSFIGFSAGHTLPNGVFSFTRRPTGGVISYKRYFAELQRQTQAGHTWESVFDTDAIFYTAGEYNRAKQTPVGWVDQYGPAHFKANRRLLLTTHTGETLPQATYEEDVVLQMPAPYWQTHKPMIPGYRLVSEFPDDALFGFKVDPEGDPYSPCEVVVDLEAKLRLAELYNSIGMIDLAAKVNSAEILTVAQLVDAIRSESIYHLPQDVVHPVGFEYEKVDPLQRQVTNINSLQNFAQLVNDGKLYVQCTGAAGFLKYSLEQAFGASCAGIVTGNTIGADDFMISAAGHAQTTFVHGDRRYILDATPAILEDQLAELSDEDKVAAQKRLSAKAIQFAQADHQHNRQVQELYKSRSLEEEVAVLTSSLLERLKVAFDLPTDATLYAYLVKLPNHDPARKTLEILRSFSSGNMSREDVLRAAEYVKKCAVVDKSARKRLKIDHYSLSFLDQLGTTAEMLSRAIYYDDPVTQ